MPLTRLECDFLTELSEAARLVLPPNIGDSVSRKLMKVLEVNGVFDHRTWKPPSAVMGVAGGAGGPLGDGGTSSPDRVAARAPIVPSTAEIEREANATPGEPERDICDVLRRVIYPDGPLIGPGGVVTVATSVLRHALDSIEHLRDLVKSKPDRADELNGAAELVPARVEPPSGKRHLRYHVLVAERASGPSIAEWLSGAWYSANEFGPITPAEMHRRGWRYSKPVNFEPDLDA